MIEEEEDCVTMEDFLCVLQERDETGKKGRKGEDKRKEES